MNRRNRLICEIAIVFLEWIKRLKGSRKEFKMVSDQVGFFYIYCSYMHISLNGIWKVESEMYSELNQTSKIEIFAKTSILDVWLSSK